MTIKLQKKALDTTTEMNLVSTMGTVFVKALK